MFINRDVSSYSKIEEFVQTGKENAYTLENSSIYKTLDNYSFPTSNVLRDKYRHIVESFCIEIELTEDEFEPYKYRPKTLSYRLYQTVDLWHVLLWINNIPTTSQFDQCKIKIIDPNRLYDIKLILEKESENLLNSRRT